MLETEGKKDSRTLEKLSGEILLSLEYFATEETLLIKSLLERVQRSPSSMSYLPVIVTTASLKKMTFNPSAVDIKNGKIDQSESTVSPVEFLRFRKNLATNLDYEKPPTNTLRELNQLNDRTVFVVQAENFIKFLSNVEFF